MFLSVAQSPKHQTDSSFARAQLKKLYLYHSNEEAFPEIERTPQGKPYFVPSATSSFSTSSSSTPWHFNLSHSKGWVAVALDTHPVGVDLQVFRPVSKKLVARVCSEGERQWLYALPSTAFEVAFAYLWAGKEAILKERGVGIGNGKKLASLSLEPSKKQDLSPLPICDFSLIRGATNEATPLARRLTPHFALAVSGLGVTGF